MAQKLKKFLKTPFWPALLSAVVAPGIGQIFNREMKKGFFLLACTMGSFFWFTKVIGDRLSLILPGTPEQWSQDQEKLIEAITALGQETPFMFLLFRILMIMLWGFGIIDAYLTAKNKKNESKPRP